MTSMPIGRRLAAGLAASAVLLLVPITDASVSPAAAAPSQSASVTTTVSRTTASPSATPTSSPATLQQASDLLAEATAEVIAAQKALEAAEAQLAQAKKDLTAAQENLDQARAENDAARQALEAAILGEKKAHDEVVAVLERMGTTRDTLGAVAREAYQGGDLMSLSAVLNAETPSEFAGRLTSMRTVLKAGDSALASLATDLAELAASEDRLTAVRALREKLAAEAGAKLLAMKKAEATAAAAEHAMSVLVVAKTAAVETAKAAREGDLAKYEAFQGVSQQLGATVTGFSADLATSRSRISGAGMFVRPGTGSVTSPFGNRYHPILRYVKLHTGTDISLGNGIVYAADRGTVVIAGWNNAYGNMTVIDHGVVNGKPLATLYAHQSTQTVKVGDVVSRGQAIGRIGSTGYSTGPHLHFEVRVGGAVVDPWPWIAHAPTP